MSIARVHNVKHARKSPGKCGKCSKVIGKGSPYLWWTVGFRSRWKQLCCDACPRPKDSELESNSSLSMLWSARDAFYDAIEAATTNEDLTSAASDAAEGVREAVSDWEEKKSNLESAWPNGCPAIEEIDEKISEAESLAEALESWEPESEADDEGDPESDAEDTEFQDNKTSCTSAWDDNCNL